MITQLDIVDKEQADNRIDHPGSIVLDTSDVSMRIYDGQTVGGFKSQAFQRAVEPTPGPNTFIGGDATSGYYGYLGAGELINTTDLMEMVGLTGGTTATLTPTWLKFSSDGKILYVAKTPLLGGVSWTTLANTNLVYGGLQIAIGNLTYKVRLMKGYGVDPTPTAPNTTNYQSGEADNSEWVKLMFKVATVTGGAWAQFTEDELGVTRNWGTGCINWMQETVASNGNALMWGNTNMRYIASYSKGSNNNYFGWRPVLELVQ